MMMTCYCCPCQNATNAFINIILQYLSTVFLIFRKQLIQTTTTTTTTTMTTIAKCAYQLPLKCDHCDCHSYAYIHRFDTNNMCFGLLPLISLSVCCSRFFQSSELLVHCTHRQMASLSALSQFFESKTLIKSHKFGTHPLDQQEHVLACVQQSVELEIVLNKKSLSSHIKMSLARSLAVCLLLIACHVQSLPFCIRSAVFSAVYLFFYSFPLFSACVAVAFVRAAAFVGMQFPKFPTIHSAVCVCAFM